MSEKTKKQQWLYQFVVHQDIEVDKKEEQEINGEKVTVTRKVTEQKPINFAIKRPNGKMHEDADMFYGVKLSEGIRSGLLTKALLVKRYRNDGGALSEPDMNYYHELLAKLTVIEDDYQRVLINIDKIDSEAKAKKIADIIASKQEILSSLQSVETINQALFAYTAETKAENKLNAWWILHLSYYDPSGGTNFVPYFDGDTYDAKVKAWDDKSEAEDKIFESVAPRLNVLVGLYLAGAKTHDEFEQGEKEFGVAPKAAEPKEEAGQVVAAP